ncbi:MAG: dephospho-CoA kinase [Methylotenera sp.]|nr:dephospho-CoA kinase [Methylotenera sp.]
MRIIGLTGGIGSGKSEAAKEFAKLGVPVVDTDAIAHTLTRVGEPLLAEITHTFSQQFLNGDASLNRAALRAHVFEHPAERIKLESLLHPAIYAYAKAQLTLNQTQLNPSYQILVIPLLFEGNRYQSMLHTTLVIDCDETTQIKRTMARSHLTETEIKRIMQTQVSRETRLQLANEVIQNDGTVEELAEKISKFHKKLIKTCIVSE